MEEEKYVWVVHYFDVAEVDIYGTAEAAIEAGQREVDAMVEYYKKKGWLDAADEILTEWAEETEQFGAEYSVTEVVWCNKQRVLY